ncbi:MAG: UDP-2,3-diacylglucosamine diphosphatase LpxI [Silicimonas sp.]|nr:UDP-2,3-diacylglucosamine diphosphatase LpxI [Silicimonas sp.]
MLALIAGQGRLPAVLVDALADLPYIATPEGSDPDFLVPDRRFRIEHLGTLINELKALGVTEVCFAGGVARPSIDPAQIDAATMPLMPRMADALQRGDDGALRELLAIFEEAGFTVRPANAYSSALLPVAGTFTTRRPDEQHKKDAARAAEVLAALGPLDVGQGCVVHQGQVLAIEGRFGTDWMLASLQHRPDGQGGLFYKAAKPGQDRRIDLPLVGVGTIAAASKARLDGVVVEEDGVMVLDLAAVERAADELGLFFQVRRP